MTDFEEGKYYKKVSAFKEREYPEPETIRQYESPIGPMRPIKPSLKERVYSKAKVAYGKANEIKKEYSKEHRGPITSSVFGNGGFGGGSYILGNIHAINSSGHGNDGGGFSGGSLINRINEINTPSRTSKRSEYTHHKKKTKKHKKGHYHTGSNSSDTINRLYSMF